MAGSAWRCGLGAARRQAQCKPRPLTCARLPHPPTAPPAQVRTCPPGVLKAHRQTCGRTVSLPVGSPVPPECRPFFPPWEAPHSGGRVSPLVRLATGAAVVGAAAAAAALFVRGALAGRRRRRLPEGGAEGEAYDPLGSWLQNSQAIRPPRQPVAAPAPQAAGATA